MGPAALLHSATTTPKVARANLALRSWNLFLVIEIIFHEEMNGRRFSCAWLAFSVFYWGFNKNLSPIFRVENLLTEKDFFRFSKLLDSSQ